MLAAGGADDPLDNEEQLADQMDSLPFLARFQYEATAEYLAGLFDPLAVLYKVNTLWFAVHLTLPPGMMPCIDTAGLFDPLAVLDKMTRR